MAFSYASLLRSWCDGMLRCQSTIEHPAMHGVLLCPSCGFIHARCADAAYPLLHMAHRTGDERYRQAAIALFDWAEQEASLPDGSFTNDYPCRGWTGITVFGALALACSLKFHAEVLDERTRTAWMTRLRSSVTFVDRTFTIATGNINYPVSAIGLLAVAAEVLGDDRYRRRADALMNEATAYFTESGILFGEGHPQAVTTDKGCRAVDLGYNIEESLPALALYARLTGNAAAEELVTKSLTTHMEFLLPDGGWDNSWGSRNFKWTYWGSRTSDGCQPGYLLMAHHDPRFAEVAWRNTQQMADCTHDGLLYGGPHLHAHGELPCIHHTFTHAKALALALDLGYPGDQPVATALPCDVRTGISSYPEIGVWQIGAGPWRATICDNDYRYGGNRSLTVCGGALSLLYHQQLGLVCCASLAQYQIIEGNNQQPLQHGANTPLTPRVSAVRDGVTYTNLTDLAAQVTVIRDSETTTVQVQGQLLDDQGNAPEGGALPFALTYWLSPTGVTLTAEARDAELIVPVISRHDEAVTIMDAGTVEFAKREGTLIASTNATGGGHNLTLERIFNLVPGLEAVELRVPAGGTGSQMVLRA